MRYAQLLLLLFVSLAMSAQPGSHSEAEVNFEKRFIEAKQEALLGNIDKAIDMFEALAKTEAENDVLHFELGRLHYTREENEAAVDALEKAYRINASPAYASLLGELYLATGQNKKGAELYGDLAKQEPDNEHFYLEQALFLVRAQSIDKAISVYNDLEKRIGVNLELSRRKHALYLGQGDKKRAEKELLILIETFPGNMEYRHLLAGYHESQGNRNAAKKVYQEILSVEPADVRAQLALEDDLTPTNGRPAPAANELMALFGRPDVAIDLKVGKLLPLVQAVANSNDPGMAEEGLRLAKELQRVHPDEAKAYALTGDLYFHSGQYVEAVAAYSQTLELDDTVYPVWEQLLHALYLTNETTTLRETAENALDVFPNRPYVYFYYAMGEVGRADFAEAVGLMQQAEFIFSAASPEAGGVARAYLMALEKLANNELPDVGELPAGAGPFYSYLQARKDFEAGNFAAVVGGLTQVPQSTGSNAVLLEILGDAYLAQEDKEKAAAAYQQAKAAGSRSRGLNGKITQTKS